MTYLRLVFWAGLTASTFLNNVFQYVLDRETKKKKSYYSNSGWGAYGTQDQQGVLERPHKSLLLLAVGILVTQVVQLLSRPLTEQKKQEPVSSGRNA